MNESMLVYDHLLSLHIWYGEVPVHPYVQLGCLPERAVYSPMQIILGQN